MIYAGLVERCGVAAVPNALMLATTDELRRRGHVTRVCQLSRTTVVVWDVNFIRRLLATHEKCASLAWSAANDAIEAT